MNRWSKSAGSLHVHCTGHPPPPKKMKFLIDIHDFNHIKFMLKFRLYSWHQYKTYQYTLEKYVAAKVLNIFGTVSLMMVFSKWNSKTGSEYFHNFLYIKMGCKCYFYIIPSSDNKILWLVGWLVGSVLSWLTARDFRDAMP